MNSAVQLEVQVDNAFAEAVSVTPIREAVEETLATVGRKQTTGLTVVITDNTSIHSLNREYRGIDAPTDVLAFSLAEGTPMPEVQAEAAYLGDVIVSYEQAVAQAAEYDQPVERELRRLVIHGTLHLLGYDDRDDDDRHEMWRVQELILDQTR
jgi:probable rRNA maturation factor